MRATVSASVPRAGSVAAVAGNGREGGGEHNDGAPEGNKAGVVKMTTTVVTAAAPPAGADRDSSSSSSSRDTGSSHSGGDDDKEASRCQWEQALTMLEAMKEVWQQRRRFVIRWMDQSQVWHQRHMLRRHQTHDTNHRLAVHFLSRT